MGMKMPCLFQNRLFHPGSLSCGSGLLRRRPRAVPVRVEFATPQMTLVERFVNEGVSTDGLEGPNVASEPCNPVSRSGRESRARPPPGNRRVSAAPSARRNIRHLLDRRFLTRTACIDVRCNQGYRMKGHPHGRGPLIPEWMASFSRAIWIASLALSICRWYSVKKASTSSRLPRPHTGTMAATTRS